jgi:hypothetical protein
VVPLIENPVGNDEVEKVKNFVATQKSEVVIKTIFKYKLANSTYQQEINTEMENFKDDKGEILDETVYSKQDGKFTSEAMVNYLYEKKTGQQFQTVELKNDNRDTNHNQGHLSK